MAKTSAAASKGGGVTGKKAQHKEEEMEFGGVPGVIGIMIFSHFLIYYCWVCLTYYQGGLAHPSSISDILPFVQRMFGHIYEGAFPTAYAFKIYWAFLVFEATLQYICPGVMMKGLPLEHEGGRQLEYNCNALWAWYITLALWIYLQWSGLFPWSTLMHHYGPLLTVSVISGNLISVLVYVASIALGMQYRMSGNLIYDFFMGASLNPRIGSLDLKMFAEIRISWMLLFFLTTSCAAYMYEVHGKVSWPMLFLCLAHGLYTNACMKGEECIPSTWDIFYEKNGWMLIFWNFAGVPFVYCFQSVYLAKVVGPIEHSPFYTGTLYVVLCCAYYVWDTANSQKNHFRMQQTGTYMKRPYAFPQLPWQTLTNPQCIVTEKGSKLLVSGWWQFARKIHYTADMVMSLCWGLICGFGSWIPFIYFAFFFSHLMHRGMRDMERCSKKYGKDWDRYIAKVPYQFIPFLF